MTQVSRHPHPSPLAGGHRGGLNDGRVDAEVAVGLLWNQSATCLSALDQVCYLGDVLIAHSQSAAVVGDVAASWVSSGTRRRCCAWPGSVLVEAHNEWQVADKRYLSEATLALLNTGDDPQQNVAATAALTA